MGARRWFSAGVLLLIALAASAPLRALRVDGQDYRGARAAASMLGMEASWLEAGERLRLHSRWSDIRLEKNQRRVEINGVRVWLGFGIAERAGELYLAEADYRHVLAPLLTPQQFAHPGELRRIVIDPGHGGRDPGAVNASLGLQEKALTLDLAKRLGKRLRAQGFEILLTRGEDVSIPLESRPQMANRAGADLFVSVHFNGSTASSAAGVETFAYTPQGQPSTARSRLHRSDAARQPGNAHDAWNTLAAYCVQRELLRATKATDRGVKRARFTVLETLACPGLLVEGGFVTNPGEGRKLASAAHRELIAAAIAEGIIQYHRRLERLARDR